MLDSVSSVAMGVPSERRFTVDPIDLREPRLFEEDRADHPGGAALGFEFQADRIGLHGTQMIHWRYAR